MKRAAGTAPPPPPLPPARPALPSHWGKGGQGLPSIKPFYRRDVWSLEPDEGSHALVHIARVVFGRAGGGHPRNHLSTRSPNAIDLTVSEEMLEAGLSLANALFNAFEARGHPVRIAQKSRFIRPALENLQQPPDKTRHVPHPLWTPVVPTIATVSGVPIGLAILEINKELEMRYVGNGEFEPAKSRLPVHGITWTEWRRVPTGRLKLVAYSPFHPIPWRREWIASRRHSLDRTAEAIVVELEAAAPTLPHAAHYLKRTRDSPTT